MRLTCRFGRAGATAGPPQWINAGAAGLVQAYGAASRGDIELVPDAAALNISLTNKAELGSFDLHQVLRQLVGNPADGWPLRTVGVLLGGRYKYAPTIFGMMFDTGFDLDVPSEGSAPKLAGLPREGCVIFLDAIADARPQPGLFQSQTLFTTIHELGHVFNLPHVPSEPNFLHTSNPEAAFDQGFWHFIEPHQQRLRSASGNRNVWPGGSTFLDPGTRGAVPDDPFHELTSKPAMLSLNAKLSRTSFYHFDPVELDIALRLDSKARRAVSVPDCLDPGYSTFRIWIEDPVGERRIYRPIRHYCWNGAMREIVPGKSFLRDVSIFGEAGGYTFRRSGEHRLWAEVALPKGERLASEPVTFEIRSVRTDKEKEKERLFSSRRSRIVLYHRVDRSRSSAIKALSAWLSRNRQDESAASVHYAIARALAEKRPRGHEKSSDLQKRISRHVQSALKGSLSKRAVQICETILTQGKLQQR